MLDRDRDGQVILEDLEVAMKKRRLPQRYAKEFLRRTRKHWSAKSIGWSEFHMLMEQKEAEDAEGLHNVKFEQLRYSAEKSGSGFLEKCGAPCNGW